ncbi:helix-turn-helix domain-containing protein [Rothia dentocariosa]|uniref:winged helix-turn-helix transcriptional regulator n=1 Tax=Rothia dentocariosa TaxID=2047 RepID=UPI0028D2056B|nr:helix-turn-helix domain-containing protein [Rothia dentocariosa]
MTTHATNTSCPIAATLEVLGEKWTLLILRDIYRGINRFNDLEASLGCPRNLLSTRLKKLVDHGILLEESYQEPGRRARTAYVLSNKGEDLALVLCALQQWGVKHLPQNMNSISYHHASCDAPVSAALICAQGHRVEAESLIPLETSEQDQT